MACANTIFVRGVLLSHVGSGSRLRRRYLERVSNEVFCSVLVLPALLDLLAVSPELLSRHVVERWCACSTNNLTSCFAVRVDRIMEWACVVGTPPFFAPPFSLSTGASKHHPSVGFYRVTCLSSVLQYARVLYFSGNKTVLY